jgi:hypothetical protein
VITQNGHIKWTTPGWVAGLLPAMITLLGLGFGMGLFASGGGPLVALVGAIWVGAAISSIVDPKHNARNALIIAFVVLVFLIICLMGVWR